MKCKNKDIKELLPAYAGQELDQTEKLRLEKHLETCEDCGAEIALLRMMAAEPVPDPGEAFWATMPDRIYRQVHMRKTAKRKSLLRDMSSLWERLAQPRWAWATAATAALVVISWLIIRPTGRDAVDVAKIPPTVEEYSYDYVEPADTIALNELDKDELNDVDAWANSEIASLGGEIQDAAAKGDTYIDMNEADRYALYEDISELSPKEIERLSQLLNKRKPEV